MNRLAEPVDLFFTEIQNIEISGRNIAKIVFKNETRFQLYASTILTHSYIYIYIVIFLIYEPASPLKIVYIFTCWPGDH